MSQGNKLAKKGGLATLQDDRDGWAAATESGGTVAGLITGDKIASVFVWLLAVICTRELTQHLAPAAAAWLLAGVGQFALTKSESPIWKRYARDAETGEWYKRPLSVYNWLALGVDALLNMGGAWFLVQRAHTFAPVRAIAEMLGTTVQPITGVWAVGICAVISVGLCAGPELLWYND